MQVYMAAVYTNNVMPGMRHHEKMTEREREICAALPHILESWHYVGKQQYVDAMRANGAKVFLDSGAFSAHTLGVTLRVEDYCDYIVRNLDIIRFEDGAMMASVLDGIGDARQTGVNQEHMEHLLRPHGVRPLPCFHAGEPEAYLDWYVRHYDYITLGGMVGASTAQLMVWLDRVWNKHLVDGSGRPRIKVHGFGITSVPLMESYPWYSCDSSSWVQTAAFGGVMLPELGPISVSEKSPSRHDAGQHATTLSALEQEYVFRRLEANGFTYERLSTVYESRFAWNLWSYGVIEAMINAAGSSKFRTHVQELF